ncbi:UpxY family transcription antiterminator [Pedobacter sp. PF22-3]|uniref:transcription termination/antitermination protein NusG n=1 Tax=Pedobacter sp. PF22-3 TaxID=2994467 RepID=UPI0022467231|nr:UpxY family transcription antiterminator [Pedobacter sp. PF22-3]MCX2492872.1 UpxY family transcription antiterminator [Pedobacter sp. PF22-3]
MSVIAKKWYVVYTKPKSEKKAASQLGELGVEYLLPMKNESRTSNDRRKTNNTPLFPSYVFVQPPDKKSYLDILDLNTVVNYVKIGKDAAIVPQSAIDNLHIITQQNCDISVTSDRFEVGQDLTIVHGQFKGLQCEVVKVDKKDFVLIRLDIFKRQILVDIPKAMLS